MKNETIYKLVIITLLFYVIFSGFINYNFIKKNKSLKAEKAELVEQVKNLDDQVNILENELQLREDEVSYWGMKYDSIKASLRKK
jgi:predicted nuclease with TOPRIM domain